MAKFRVIGGAAATSILHKRETLENAPKRPVGRPVGSKTEKREGVHYGRPTKEMMGRTAESQILRDAWDAPVLWGVKALNVI